MINHPFLPDFLEKVFGDQQGDLQVETLEHAVHKVHQVQALGRSVERLWVTLPQLHLENPDLFFGQPPKDFTNSLFPTREYFRDCFFKNDEDKKGKAN